LKSIDYKTAEVDSLAVFGFSPTLGLSPKEEYKKGRKLVPSRFIEIGFKGIGTSYGSIIVNSDGVVTTRRITILVNYIYSG
jgi:hypothetical protein